MMQSLHLLLVWLRLRSTQTLLLLATPPSFTPLMEATCIASQQWQRVQCWMCLALHILILMAGIAHTTVNFHSPILQVAHCLFTFDYTITLFVTQMVGRNAFYLIQNLNYFFLFEISVDGVSVPEEDREGYAWLQEREKPEDLTVDGAPYKGPKIVGQWSHLCWHWLMMSSPCSTQLLFHFVSCSCGSFPSSFFFFFFFPPLKKLFSCGTWGTRSFFSLYSLCTYSEPKKRKRNKEKFTGKLSMKVNWVNCQHHLYTTGCLGLFLSFYYTISNMYLLLPLRAKKIYV